MATTKSYMALCLDVETTGLVQNATLTLDKQPEVLEFFACLVDLKTGKIKKELNILIKPSRLPLPAIITKITGITDDMLEDAVPFAQAAKKIFPFIQKAPLIIAHNASFDKEMLDIEAQRLNVKIKWPRIVCTVEQTIAMKGFRLSLANLHEHLFNEKFSGAHRAREDVMALLRCCVELHKRDVL